MGLGLHRSPGTYSEAGSFSPAKTPNGSFPIKSPKNFRGSTRSAQVLGSVRRTLLEGRGGQAEDYRALMGEQD
jgi:hypothetical protein